MGKKYKKIKEKNQVRFYSSDFNFTQYCLVLNDSDLDQVCGYLGIEKHEFGEMPKAGRVDFLENPQTGQNMAVIRIAENDNCDLATHVGLIVHECVHIKQQVMQDIGEESPSSEFEAYFTQGLTVTMISEFLRRSKTLGDKNGLTC